MKHTSPKSKAAFLLLLLLSAACLLAACTPAGGESGGSQTTQVPDPATPADSTSEQEGEPTAPPPDPHGASVGDLCYVQDVKTIGDDPYNYDTLFNITQNSGKITVLNFWFTTCIPCTEELPHFDRIATEYADQVLVVALHAADGYLESFQYIKSNYKNSAILFGLDEQNAYYQKLEGNGGYPMTLILDGDGKIIAKYNESVTYDILKSVIDPLVNS